MLIKMAALTFEGNFVWIGCTSEAQKEVSYSAQFPLIDELKKYMISGVTFKYHQVSLRAIKVSLQS